MTTRPPVYRSGEPSPRLPVPERDPSLLWLRTFAFLALVTLGTLGIVGIVHIDAGDGGQSAAVVVESAAPHVDFGPVETYIAWEARTKTPTATPTVTSTPQPTTTPRLTDMDLYGLCGPDVEPGAICVEVQAPAPPEVETMPTCTVDGPVVGKRTCRVPGEHGQSSGRMTTE